MIETSKKPKMRRVIVEGVSKKFRISFKKNQGTLERFISVFSGKLPKKDFWALKDVSFSADEGEIIGIIGKNGSGKTTLLRIISGIYDKDEGKIFTNGKVISMIGLYIGLKRRLPMKDNIYFISSIVGMGQKEIKNKFDSIVKFSELDQFVNTKLYQFSDGMRQRLAFSIAIHAEPEIILLDEVFEVGDEGFKYKSAKTLKNLAKKGATVLLATHDLHLVKKYCKRIIWLEKGKIKKIGSKKIIDEYEKASKNI